jgi:hypothetical protein
MDAWAQEASTLEASTSCCLEIKAFYIREGSKQLASGCQAGTFASLAVLLYHAYGRCSALIAKDCNELYTLECL